MNENDPTNEKPPESPTPGKQAAGDVGTVAKGGAVQIAGQISQRGVAMLFTAVASRVIGTAGLGLYRQVSEGLPLPPSRGLPASTTHRCGLSPERAEKEPGGVRGAARVGLAGAAIGAGIAFVLLLLFADELAAAFGDPKTDLDELEELFRLGAIYIPFFAFMQVFRYCTQAYKTMVPSVVAGNIIQPIARFVLGMVAFAAGLEVAGAVSSLAVSMGIGMLAAAYYYRRMLTQEERVATPKADRER